MTLRLMGLIVGSVSGRIYGHVWPCVSDAELDDPALVDVAPENGEMCYLVKLERDSIGDSLDLATMTHWPPDTAS